MEQEIKDIIAKNIPEQVGTVLKQRLERAEKDAHDNEVLRERLDEKNDEIKMLYKEISDLKKNEIHKEFLDKLQDELNTKGRALELEITKIKLEEAIKRSEATYRLTEQIFRSPVTRKQIENMTLSSYDSQGRYNQTAAVPTHITETID
jgi:glucan-binding YG repeat protein